MGLKVLVLFSDIKEQFESSKQSQWSLMFVFLSIAWKLLHGNSEAITKDLNEIVLSVSKSIVCSANKS